MDLKSLTKHNVTITVRVRDLETGEEQQQDLASTLLLSDDGDVRGAVSGLCREIHEDIENQLGREAEAGDEDDDADWDDGTCGDCAEGSCHGSDPGNCGCDRHDASKEN